MIDRRLIALVAAVVLVWAWAGVGRTQDLSDLFGDFQCPEQRVCPPPPPRSVCGFEFGVDVRLRTEAPEAVTVLTLKCGEYLFDGVIEGCVLVSAFNELDELTSATVERSYPAEECQPVPEPGIVLGIFAGCLVLAILSRRRF